MTPEVLALMVAAIAATPPTLVALGGVIIAAVDASRARQAVRDQANAQAAVHQLVNKQHSDLVAEVAELKRLLGLYAPLPRRDDIAPP